MRKDTFILMFCLAIIEITVLMTRPTITLNGKNLIGVQIKKAHPDEPKDERAALEFLSKVIGKDINIPEKIPARREGIVSVFTRNCIGEENFPEQDYGILVPTNVMELYIYAYKNLRYKMIVPYNIQPRGWPEGSFLERINYNPYIEKIWNEINDFYDDWRDYKYRQDMIERYNIRYIYSPYKMDCDWKELFHQGKSYIYQTGG